MIRSSRVVLLAAAGAVSLVTACGGASHASSPTADPSPTATASNPGAFRASGPPGASGLIAEIDGNTLQVQNQTSGQVAVDLTTTTTYTQAKAASLSSVTVGSCIVATAPQSSSSTTATPAPSTSSSPAS